MQERFFTKEQYSSLPQSILDLLPHAQSGAMHVEPRQFPPRGGGGNRAHSDFSVVNGLILDKRSQNREYGLEPALDFVLNELN